MKTGRRLACLVLVLVVGASLAAGWLAPAGYAKQYREAAGAAPSAQHWLGTDEIGRDRFARVLYGTRISLLLAPAAALLSTLLAAVVGGLAGYVGGVWARVAMAVTDLFLSLPHTDIDSSDDDLLRLAQNLASKNLRAGSLVAFQCAGIGVRSSETSPLGVVCGFS